MAELSGLAGSWQGLEHRSFESLDMSRLDEGMVGVALAETPAGLTFETPVLLDMTDEALLANLVPGALDVDAVDALLETTDHEDAADLLSDTPCGPGDLPQFVASVTVSAEIEVEARVTVIAYFTDRLLSVVEMTGRSDEAFLYVTMTTLLTRADQATE
ncbi:hypothetical protein [Jannaschia sp. AI_61]|nr:hypothetical protein [Jannaschia sp. AI_61]